MTDIKETFQENINEEYSEESNVADKTDEKHEGKAKELIDLITTLNQNSDKNLPYITINMYGDYSNVINADTINDSDIQRSESNALASKVSKEKSQIKSEDDFEKFVDQYKNTKTLSALIAVASLDRIEERNFDYVCDELKSRLDELTQPTQEDLKLDSPFESRYRLLKTAFMRTLSVKRNTHTGLIDTNCICFSDETMAERIRIWLWIMYPQFRSVVIDWLLHIGLSNDWFLSATAQNGVAEYATIDFDYTISKIITKLRKNLNNYNISTLSMIIERFYEKNLNKDNVENLLLQWISEKNDLWMVSFRLWAKGYAQKCEGKMLDVINKCLFSSERRKEKYFMYIMGFAHRSEFISNSIINILNSHFTNCSQKSEKDYIAQTFLWLLLFDYFTTDEIHKLLVFVNSSNSKNTREKMRPIIHYVLGYHHMRKNLFEILNSFFAEYNANSGEWASTEKFIRELAFTGKKEDFERVISWLTKSRDSLPDFSAHMIAYLNNMLFIQNNSKEKLICQ
ncbi:MAG: hypothetical protein IJA02_10740 [Clostridia bacterium]|nr:hypothetical protein [Clostridia bacterium]